MTTNNKKLLADLAEDLAEKRREYQGNKKFRINPIFVFITIIWGSTLYLSILDYSNEVELNQSQTNYDYKQCLHNLET